MKLLDSYKLVVVIGENNDKTNENVFSKEELKKMKNADKNLRKSNVKKSYKVLLIFFYQVTLKF